MEPSTIVGYFAVVGDAPVGGRREAGGGRRERNAFLSRLWESATHSTNRLLVVAGMCELSPTEFRLIIQALIQSGDDGKHLALRLQPMDNGPHVPKFMLSPLPTETSPRQDPMTMTIPGKEVGARPHDPRNCTKLARIHWNIGDKMARTSTASSDALISALAAIHPESHATSSDWWMDSIKYRLGVTHAHCNDSLANSLLPVIERCATLTSKDVGVRFMLMLNYIELAVECQRFVVHVATQVCSQRTLMLASWTIHLVYLVCGGFTTPWLLQRPVAGTSQVCACL